MDPNQNMPMDPNAMGPEATPEAGQEMATPEEINSLKEMMDQIEEKYREMNAENFAGSNQVESFRKDLIVDVFKALQSAGVDVSNVEEVKKFLDRLEESNPDLYDLFVQSFNGLMGEEGTLPGTAAESALPEAVSGEVPGGALGQMPGALPTTPEPTPGGMPSNEGLSGMVPPSSGPGLSQKFPNLAR